MRGARLYVRLYLALLISLALAVLLIAVAWRHNFRDGEVGPQLDLAIVVAAELLPPANAPPQQLDAALARWSGRLGANLVIFAADGRRVAGRGFPELHKLSPDQLKSGWQFNRRGPPRALLGLPDGRWLLAGRVHGGHRVSIGFVASIAIIAVAVALAAYPVVRRLTRRLETLQRSVEALGAGDLSARVAIEGRDEVAALAASFNRSAERIEALLRSQRSLLANTSHELRSPLARLRLALELGETQPQAEWIDEVKRNIAEIDVLLDEILLASRLDAGLEQDLPRELVHLDALVIEECARYGAACDTEPTRITGNDALLRRLLRNLLQNAQRYGGGTATVALRGDGHVTRLSVTDHGPGVPDAERERVFEPFYRLPAAPPGGTGLGLALVRQIARNHGGDASCEPAPSGGASFVVRLPVQESSTTDSPSNTR